MVTYVTALLNCRIFIKLHVRNFNFRLAIYFNVVFINASIVSVFLKYNCCNDYLLVHKLVLVITCLGGQFGIDCPSAFLKIFKNHEEDLSPELPETNVITG